MIIIFLGDLLECFDFEYVWMSIGLFVLEVS